MSSNLPGSAEIFQDWSLYDRVIHFNYMQHREMALAIRSIAAALPQPLVVVDLGCGDGRMAGQGLRDIAVARFQGVDLSPAALDAARANLAHLNSQLDLRQSDLATALAEGFDPSPNLVLASYSLHHYRPELAAGLIGAVANTLSPGGAFVWIDLEQSEAEARPEFLDRFYREQLLAWNAFGEADVQEIMTHMREADFPLTGQEKLRLASAAGLAWNASTVEDQFYAAHVFLKK